MPLSPKKRKCQCQCKCVICSGKMTYEQQFEAYRDMCDEYGVAVTGYAGLTYSVGLAKAGMPDIVITVPDQKFAQIMINQLSLYWKKHPERIDIGDCSAFIKEVFGSDAPATFLEADISDKSPMLGELKNMTEFYTRYPTYAGNQPRRVFHMVFSNKEYLFPWDDDYSQEAFPQPAISQYISERTSNDMLELCHSATHVSLDEAIFSPTDRLH